VAVIVWSVIGAVLALFLLAAWLMDRSARRHGTRVLDSKDIQREVREGHRDARMIDNGSLLPAQDISWTSWSRRNHGGR